MLSCARRGFAAATRGLVVADALANWDSFVIAPHSRHGAGPRGAIIYRDDGDPAPYLVSKTVYEDGGQVELAEYESFQTFAEARLAATRWIEDATDEELKATRRAERARAAEEMRSWMKDER